MTIDWTLVKKQTLWHYEELLKKLQKTLSYTFVREGYNHSMSAAIAYVRDVRRGYLQNGDDHPWLDTIIATFQHLDAVQVQTYLDFIQQVATKADCAAFLARTGIDFADLIQTLNYLLRWVLPFPTPLRELIDTDDAAQMAYFQALKQQHITSNLDLLAAGRTVAGRTHLTSQTGIPADFLLTLVHRADMTRLAYVRGKTVKHLCGGGYDTLDKLAHADLSEMAKHMETYYQILGKRLADFKSVIPLVYMVGGAQIVPRVVEELEKTHV